MTFPGMLHEGGAHHRDQRTDMSLICKPKHNPEVDETKCFSADEKSGIN